MVAQRSDFLRANDITKSKRLYKLPVHVIFASSFEGGFFACQQTTKTHCILSSMSGLLAFSSSDIPLACRATGVSLDYAIKGCVTAAIYCPLQFYFIFSFVSLSSRIGGELSMQVSFDKHALLANADELVLLRHASHVLCSVMLKSAEQTEFISHTTAA